VGFCECLIQSGAFFQLDFIVGFLAHQELGRLAAPLAKRINFESKPRSAADWQ